MSIEYIPACKKVLYISIVLLLAYFLYVFNIELVVDFIIMLAHSNGGLGFLLPFNHAENAVIVKIIFLSIPSTLFFIYIFIISYLVVSSKALPPKNVSLPFGMNRVHGNAALFLGYLGLMASILKIAANFYEIYEMYELLGSWS